MLDKMKQLMEVKRQAEQLKRELDASYAEVEDVPGIKIKISGSQNFTSLTIDSNLLSVENKAKLENDLLLSLNGAIRKSQSIATLKMKAMAGLNIPGF